MRIASDLKMINYTQAVKKVMKQGNYPLLFKIIPYMIIALIIHNVSLFFIDYNAGINELVIFRITTISVLFLVLLHRVYNREAVPGNIVIYELIIAFCLPFCQIIQLYENMSTWYIYIAVIFGGLFYGLFSGYFLIPVVASPILYFIASQFSAWIFHKSLTCEFANNAGILIVMWFSAISSSAARIGFDVFYFLRVALHEQALTFESLKKLNESAKQKLLLEKEISKLKSVETLGLYAGGIAHDFNNMLTVIAGQMMSLRRSTKDDTEKQNIESIMQAVKKTSGLIKKMLLFTGQYDNHLRVFALNESIQSAIDLLSHGTEKKNEIESLITDDIAEVYGDENLFQTALIGFLVNLIQYPKKRSKLEINMNIVNEYKNVPVKLAKAEKIQTVKFAVLTVQFGSQSDFLWEKNESFVELVSIAIDMGGKINTGKSDGKDFIKMSLPLVKDKIAGTEPKTIANKNVMKILIIDDDKMVLKSIKEVLINAGYTVIACNDADDAKNIFKANFKEIGLVLLDMQMPEKSGKEVYFELKKIDPELKVIIVSGYCSDIDMQELMNEGVMDYIEKPYTEEDLYAKVASVI